MLDKESMKSNLKKNENFDIIRLLMTRSTWRGILPSMGTWLNMRSEWTRMILLRLRTKRLCLTILCLESCLKLSFQPTQSLIRKLNEWSINQSIETKEQSKNLETLTSAFQTHELKTLDSQPQQSNTQSRLNSTKQNTTLKKCIPCTKQQILPSKILKFSVFTNPKTINLRLHSSNTIFRTVLQR